MRYAFETSIVALVACLAIFAAAGNKATKPTRPEAHWGLPTPAEAERSGYLRGHTGHYTEWVCEHLTKRKLEQGRQVERGDDFRADADVPVEWRATLKDYEGSELDRGHQSPAADNSFSTTAESESFLLSNMMPQTKQLNRGPWSQLERHIRELVTDGSTEVWALTGPAWLPDADGIILRSLGAHAVWTPTHCWKAALVARDGIPTATYAWLAPNDHEPGEFTTWPVSIDTLEAATGLDFWADLPDDFETKWEARKP